MAQLHETRRRLRTLTVAVLLSAAVVGTPFMAGMAQADDGLAITVNNSTCPSTSGSFLALVGPNHVDSGSSSICLVILSNATLTDTISFTVFTAAGAAVAQGSAPAQPGAAFPELILPNITYAPSPDGPWPDGSYHTDISLNGQSAFSDQWAVGGGVAAPAIPTVVPPTNTPIPPTATSSPVPATSTPVPPTATPSPAPPTATPSPALPATAHSCPTKTTQEVVRCVEPSILQVSAHGMTGLLMGTGVVVRSDQFGTYVLTSAHLLQGSKVTQIVLFSLDGKRHFTAQAVATKRAKAGSGGDLALIRLQPLHLSALTWGNSDHLKVGQTVISITAGTGSPAPRIGVDTIAALHIDRKDGLGRFWMLHGTSTKQSVTGGLLFSQAGAIVGINVQQSGAKGILAIPAANAKAVTATLMFALSTQPSASALTKESATAIATATLSATATTTATATATATATVTATATATATATVTRLATVVPTSTAVPPAPAVPTATAVPQAPAAAAFTTYTGAGYTIQLPAGWTVSAAADGHPLLFSASMTLTVSIDAEAAPLNFSQSYIQPVISQVAASLGTTDGVQYSVSFQPLTIGAMTGFTGVLTRPDGKWTVLLGAVSDGTHLVIVQITYFPVTLPADLQQAAQVIASVQTTT
jgi:hypothetical protein